MRYSEKQTLTEVKAILHDQPFGEPLDIFRNIKTLTTRVMNEGFSFLTKTLPRLLRAFDRALSGNATFDTAFFLKKNGRTGFPHFLGSALRRIFRSDGFILEEPCVATIKWLRTLFSYCYKIEVPFNEEQLDSYSEKFRQTDRSITELSLHDFDECDRVVSGMASMLRSLESLKLSQPSFGPGISSNCRRESKYDQPVVSSKLTDAFGYRFFELDSEFNFYLMVEKLFFYQLLPAIVYLLIRRTSSELVPSKVLFVPKDSRGPRTICCEDSRLMYAQKSIQKSLYSFCESRFPFSGRVNFTDQEVNQLKTFDKKYATIDLKDASDLVSLDLVRSVFPPKLFSMMDACRSPECTLPDGSIVVMNKFAPMGSALCFPILALCVYSAVVSGISSLYGLHYSDVDVYVYGDDLIVPNEYADCAMSSLESIGLKINKDKSFVNSRFTESCGQDTFDVSDVTPIRKKKFLQKKEAIRYKGRTHFKGASELAHNVSLVNSAVRAGYNNLANSLKNAIKSAGFAVPYGVPESGYINYNVLEGDNVWYSNLFSGFEVNGKLRAFCIRDRDIDFTSPHDSYAMLRRQLLEGGAEETVLSSKAAARSPLLQPRTLIIWGTSYC